MTHRTLVLGGARSGKSAYAEGLLPADGPVTYLATGVRDPADAEWTARIDAHVARRSPHWRTLDNPDVVATIEGAHEPEMLLLDDLATWLAGRMDVLGAWDADPAALAAVGRLVGDLVAAVIACRTRLVLVSAEVGLGVVPETRSGRLFRDELGSLNTRLAQVCEESVLLVAGLPVELKRPRR